ncbi:MAG TPA: polysaccharide pyruvyl transferase family protein [Verrucomicrobiae bacterium]|nr:polysaccharide pyruvyl transferase family protein [Verrucomicrobiae bacterium]
MSGIAVVSAANIKNYGMYSVDLSGDVFFRKLNRSFTPVVTQGFSRAGKLRFQVFRRPQDFAAFDKVIFWGDFLNNPMWGCQEYAKREARHYRAANLQEGMERWRELYLGLKRHCPATRILAVGGCFLGANENLEPSFRQALEEFLDSAELVAPRDERSLEILRALAPGAKLAEGIDCAWLLAVPRRKERNRGYFIYFFGRTLQSADISWIEELSRRTGLRAVTLNWLDWDQSHFKAHWYFKWMQWRIAGAEFVVTDTYHLALNSLNAHRRVVCLYDSGQRENEGSCGDAKKPLLLRQVGLPQLLLDVNGENFLAAAVYDRLQTIADDHVEKALAVFAGRREKFRRLVETALAKPACS